MLLYSSIFYLDFFSLFIYVSEIINFLDNRNLKKTIRACAWGGVGSRVQQLHSIYSFLSFPKGVGLKGPQFVNQSLFCVFSIQWRCGGHCHHVVENSWHICRFYQGQSSQSASWALDRSWLCVWTHVWAWSFTSPWSIVSLVYFVIIVFCLAIHF